MKTFTREVFGTAMVLATWAAFEVRLALTRDRAARFRLLDHGERAMGRWAARLAK